MGGRGKWKGDYNLKKGFPVWLGVKILFAIKVVKTFFQQKYFFQTVGDVYR